MDFNRIHKMGSSIDAEIRTPFFGNMSTPDISFFLPQIFNSKFVIYSSRMTNRTFKKYL